MVGEFALLAAGIACGTLLAARLRHNPRRQAAAVEVYVEPRLPVSLFPAAAEAPDPWQFFGEYTRPFIDGRMRNVADCERLMRIDRARMFAGEITPAGYIERCRLYLESYCRFGDALEAIAVANSLPPADAHALRQRFYDYPFEPPELAAFRFGEFNPLTLANPSAGDAAPRYLQ